MLTKPYDLKLAEAVALEAVGAHSLGGSILELGSGIGRATGHLLRVSKDYLGLESSLPKLERARNMFPGVEFKQGGVLGLSDYPQSKFDLVVFSGGDFDDFDAQDRPLALNAIVHVLKAPGAFIFSCKNCANDQHSGDNPVTINEQPDQLLAAGFKDIEIIGEDGQELQRDDNYTGNRIWFLAQK